MRVATLVAVVGALVVVPIAVFVVTRSSRPSAPGPVVYAQVQQLFDRSCARCHPSGNPALDLTPGHSYRALINTRALEDPRYLRVAVGDPGRSFLYLKVAGFSPAGDIGARMPFRRPPLAAAQVALLRAWIVQGARGPDGRLPPPSVHTPGGPPLPAVGLATSPAGSGTITGSVIDEKRRPIADALVTLLLHGPSLPGGEEHYRVATTDASGHYALTHAPAGRFELKAYAPGTIYTSHVVALRPGGAAAVDFGLANRPQRNPRVARARVILRHGVARLSMTVTGRDLDPNYTLAVQPASGRVYELRRPGATAGVWSRTIHADAGGRWIFMAVDRNCSVSDFLTLRA